MTPSQAGDNVTCPQCQTELAVPTMRAVRELEQAQMEPVPSRKREWSSSQGAMFAAGLLLTIAGLGIGASFNYLSSTSKLKSRLDTDMGKISQEIDSFGPVQAIKIWEELEKPLDDWEESPYAKSVRVSESQKTYSLVGFGLGLIGVCVTVGAFFIKPAQKRVGPRKGGRPSGQRR